METKPRYTHAEMFVGITAIIGFFVFDSMSFFKIHTEQSIPSSFHYGQGLINLFTLGFLTGAFATVIVLVYGLLKRILDKQLLSWIDIEIMSVISLVALLPSGGFLAKVNPYWQEIGALLAGGIVAFFLFFIFLLIFPGLRKIKDYFSLTTDTGTRYARPLYAISHNGIIFYLGFIASPLLSGMIYDGFRDQFVINRLGGMFCGVLLALFIHFVIFGVWVYDNYLGKYLGLILAVISLLLFLGVRFLNASSPEVSVWIFLSGIVTFIALKYRPAYYNVKDFMKGKKCIDVVD